MPRLTQTVEVVTTTEVTLSARLTKQLKTKLVAYAAKRAEAAKLKVELDTDKEELETLFADAGEYEALEAGVRVNTPMGDVPMKIITGSTTPKLNMSKLMKKFSLTPDDIASCTDPGKAKKPYLGIFLPTEQEDE